MKRVLMVHPWLRGLGGATTVAAWVLEALRDENRVTLLSWLSPRLEEMNRYYGTSLRDGDFELRLVRPHQRRAVDLLPTSAELLRRSVLTRSARRLLRREACDVAISTTDEMDFGRRGIQYIHYPYNYLPRPDCHNRWYHRNPLGLPLYWRFCDWLADSSRDGVRRNLSLVNSNWTGDRVREFYGVDSITVYPPVPGDFPRRAESEREDGFVCVGRFNPVKELEKVIEILAAVRGRGHDVRLHLVGSPVVSDYARKIADLAAWQGPWIRLHHDLPRRELVGLIARNRYGIHGMVGEHFGIAVAELQQARSIVFAPNEGGPVEILGHDPRLLYLNPRDAVEKIDRVIRDPQLRESILRGIHDRRKRFSTATFMSQIRRIVAELDAGP